MISRIALGMQCFWGAEAHFGWHQGVISTRVGYGGGSTPSPTYRNLADHIEIVDVEFDSKKITLHQILKYFFSHHDATEKYKRQYESAILYRDKKQKEEVNEYIEKFVPGKVVTGVYPLNGFNEAEDYHQKYFFRKNKELFNSLSLTNREIIDSPIVTKLNSFSAGFGDFIQFEDFLFKENFSITEKSCEYIREQIRLGPVLGECGI